MRHTAPELAKAWTLASILLLATSGCAATGDDGGSDAGGGPGPDAAGEDGGVTDGGVTDGGAPGDAGQAPDAGPGMGCIMGGGAQHTCARLEDGTLWCWGSNSQGQLGLGSDSSGASSPTQVSALSNEAELVAPGTRHTCATKQDGSVWCWGDNEHGAVGTGSLGGAVFEPTRVDGPADVTQIEAREGYSCALEESGAVWCWGHNWVGQVGDGTTESRASPVELTSLGTSNSAIALGGNRSCALKTDGTVWCWGQIGSSSADTSAPVHISGFGSDNVEIDLSNFTVCTRKADSSLWCMGTNTYGQATADGTTGDYVGTPQEITSVPETAASWALLGAASCVRTESDSLYCWGHNGYGQLGVGNMMDQYAPTEVSALSGRVARADGAGWNHACVREADGSIWCWGNNNSGQLGDGTMADQPTPVRVSGILCPPSLI